VIFFENGTSGTSGKKTLKLFPHTPIPSSKPRQLNHHYENTFLHNGNLRVIRLKDKARPNPLANKLGKNGKITGDQRGRPSKKFVPLLRQIWNEPKTVKGTRS